MKKTFAGLLILVLLLALPLSMTYAAEERGELLITSEPVEGKVGDIVKVNFYLYPNLPDGLKLNSITCMIKFDPAFLKFGTINQIDEEGNQTSLMKGKGSLFLFNESEPGLLKLAFSDGYGVEAEGFWFQAEFRIETDGACDFVINGFSYSAINDEEDKTVSFYIDPVSVGGIYTEGQSVPTDGAAEETYEPISPVIESSAPATPTARPSTPPPTVPVTTTLPTFSARPTSSDGIVTPRPPVTPTPVPSASAETAAPTSQAPDTTEGPVAEVSPAPNSEQPTDLPENSEEPLESEEPLPVEVVTPDPNETDPKASPVPAERDSAGNDSLSTFAIIAIIGGIAAVIGVGILLIVLVLKRRNA